MKDARANKNSEDTSFEAHIEDMKQCIIN